MIIKIEENIKSFSAWRDGVSKEDASKFTVIVKYATMEGFEAFKNDKELHAARAAAGVDLDSAKITPMDGDFMENFSG